MRWKWETNVQKHERFVAKMTSWQRRFAWRVYRDEEAQTSFWLEFVWVKHRSRDNDGCYPWIATVRGGRQAPEVKTCPPGTKETAV